VDAEGMVFLILMRSKTGETSSLYVATGRLSWIELNTPTASVETRVILESQGG